MTSATANTMFQAVTASCCPSEYAVAASVTPASAATFVAWLTPTPPGVTETVLAIEFPPITAITVWNVTAIPYPDRNTAITPSLASQAPNDGSTTPTTYRPGWARIAPPCVAFSTTPWSLRLKMRTSMTASTTAPAVSPRVRTG